MIPAAYSPACKGSTKDFNIRISWKSERKDSDSSFPEIPEFTNQEYWGNHFWSAGYCVDTVGMDAEMIRKHVKFQDKK